MTKKSMNRRGFLASTGAAGLASLLLRGDLSAENQEPNVPADPNKNDQPQFPQVPRRKLGKSDVQVPILNLGGMFDIPNNQAVLKTAIKWGVTYWDTAHGYMNGNSEIGIGKFLKKNPEMREKLFIVTKASGAKSVDDI